MSGWALTGHLLIGLGGLSLLLGLLLALRANRDEARAIAATRIAEDIYGRPSDAGTWEREAALKNAERRFRWGVGMTIAGVALQTIGSLLPR